MISFKILILYFKIDFCFFAFFFLKRTMEWLTVVRTCRPEKPGVGLTRQSRCPARTHAYYMQAVRERDYLWFNWQLRKTLFHVKNYHNQRKHWIVMIKKHMQKKVRVYYPVVASHILSYLDYDKLPKRTNAFMPPPMGWVDNLDYTTLDISRVCRTMGDRLALMGYPVEPQDISEMDVYLDYYTSTLFLSIDLEYVRALYRILEDKQIRDPWRILYSHMMVQGYGGEAYDYREGFLHSNYPTKRSNHYFKLWAQRSGLVDGSDPMNLVTSWFERMKRPSIRG